MDYSSLVAARPTTAPFSVSSTRKRRAAIVCASIMLISCAALVASLVTPHRPILAADIERSLLLHTALADVVPSPSILQRRVRFTVLESNPIDSALKKAMLPTLTDMTKVMMCVPTLTKGMKSLASSPSTSKISSLLKDLDKCAEKMSGLADQCESSPSLMALAMVPNIGSFVSFVCAQAGSLVQKYEYYKTTLQSGRSLVRVGVIASGKGGGSDPISKGLEKAGLPGLHDLEKIVKCVPQVSKGIAKLANNGDIASVKSALSKLDNCVGQLEGLVESCEGPAVMALSMIPNVGSVVGFVCAQASSMVGQFRSVSDRINSGFSIVTSVSHAVSMDEVESRHVRLTQLAGISIKKIGDSVKKVADKVEKKIPDKIKDVATDVANKAANVAKDVASKTVDVAKDAGDALKSLGNPIDIVLNKAGLPTLAELTKVVECSLPVAKGLKKLTGNPSMAKVNEVLDSLKKCMNKLEDVADKCENPAVMVISSAPMIGPVVALACSVASSMVEKYGFYTDLVSRGIAIGNIVV